MRNVLTIVICVFISSFFIADDKNNKSLSDFFKLEINEINLEGKYNFLQFYKNTIFNYKSLNNSLNEKSLIIENSNSKILISKLTKIDEVEIEEDLQQPSFSEIESSMDFQSFTEEKSQSSQPINEKIDFLDNDEQVEEVKTEDTQSDIIQNEIVSKEDTEIVSIDDFKKQQIDSEEIEVKEVQNEEKVNNQQEPLATKKVTVLNPQKTLNEAIYFYTFEGENAPDLKKGLNEELLEYLRKGEFDFNDLLNIFKANNGKTISKKTLKKYKKNK